MNFVVVSYLLGDILAKVSSKAYFRKYFKNRRADRRFQALMALGGRCEVCGSLKDLQFDHVIRGSRKWIIANILAYGDTKFWDEVAKCQLLCDRCHRQKTIKDRGQMPAAHGRTRMYRLGCRCDLCKKVASAYGREWKRRRKAEWPSRKGAELQPQ